MHACATTGTTTPDPDSSFDLIAHLPPHGGQAVAQARLNSRTPLVPPKPNEFDWTTSTRTSRAVFGT